MADPGRAVGNLMDDLVRVDWEQVRIRRAVSGLVAMLTVIAVLIAIGDQATATLLATLFVTAASGDGSMRERLPGMVRFTVVGALLGGLAFWSSESGVAVAIVLGIATYLGTLAAAFGPTAAKAGLYLTLWPLFALMLGRSDTEPWTVVVGFAIGGAVAITATAVRLAIASEDEAGDIEEPEEIVVPFDGSMSSRIGAAARSPVGRFALLRTTGVVAASVIGYWLFPAYPLWVAITVIVVVKPSAHQSLSTATQRTVGTAIGVGVALVIAQVLPRDDGAVAVAFLVSGVLMIAFNNANYTLFAAFLTAMLVFGQRLAEADAFDAGWERLAATVVGAGIGVVVMGIAAGATRRHPAGGGPEGAESSSDKEEPP